MIDSLTVELHPVWTRGSRGYRYNVTHDGEVIVSLSADPETDLARALLEQDIKGNVTVLDANTGKPRARVNTERAPKLRTLETGNAPRFCKETCADELCAGESPVPGKGLPANSFGADCAVNEAAFPQKNFPARAEAA